MNVFIASFCVFFKVCLFFYFILYILFGGGGGFLCNIGKECSFYYSPMIIVKKNFFFLTLNEIEFGVSDLRI